MPKLREITFGKQSMTILEMFSDAIYIALRGWRKMTCQQEEYEENACDRKLNFSYRFFRKAFDAYENDACIENILRSIKKLECGVAALINNDPEKLKYQKILYYSNQINLPPNYEHFKISNKSLEFLQRAHGVKKIKLGTVSGGELPKFEIEEMRIDYFADEHEQDYVD